MFGFVLRNHKKGLVYDGDAAKLDLCMDMRDAVDRWKIKVDDDIMKEKTGKVYGRTWKYKLPIFDTTSPNSPHSKLHLKDVTGQFLDYIIKQAKAKLISDISLGQWMEILGHYDVKMADNGFIGFCPLDESSTSKYQLDNRGKSEKIMMKEFMDGYSYFDKYEYKQGGETTPIEISHRYDFEDGITVPYNYTLALRKAMFGANQGQSIGPNKLLMDRQYDVILRQAKKTIVYGARRAGKTFLLAFLARREIMAQRLNFQNQYRPISVLYLGLSDNKNMKVVSYLMGMDRMFAKNAEGMFTWNQGQRIYSFKSGKDVLGTITFLSAEAKDPGVGDYADLIIVDEAIKMPNSIWEGIEPIVTNEGAKLLTASTLYYDAPKGWNYNLMLEAEKYQLEHSMDIYKWIDENWNNLFHKLSKKDNWTMEDRKEYQNAVNQRLDNNEWAGLRYTIDDIEYIPEQRRENEKERMWQANPQRYYAELYSRFSDEGKVFNYNGCLKDLGADGNKTYQHVAVVHDSANTYDASAALVGGRDPTLKKVVILAEHEVKKTGYYEDQAKEIKGLIEESKKLLTHSSNPALNRVYFVCDGNQKATAELFQMAGVDIDYRICYSAKGEGESHSKYIYNEINIPKSIMIDIATKMLENGFVLISTEAKKLINEMDSYTRITNPATGTIKYMKGKTDDFIHAYMMLCYFYYEKLNLKVELVQGKKEIVTNDPTHKEIRDIKMQQLQEQQKKDRLDKQTRQNQLYFYNNVY